MITKKILLSIATLFLIWQSYEWLSNIHRLETDSWALLLFIAWVINMFITGIFAFSGFAFPTQKLMPSDYYQIRDPSQLKKIYQTLKVESFRKFLLATFWKNQKQRNRYFDGKKGGMEHLVTETQKAEFGHLIPFVIITLISFYLIVTGMIMLGSFTFAFNWIGNFYPIILQRHHRMRVENIRLRHL